MTSNRSSAALRRGVGVERGDGENSSFRQSKSNVPINEGLMEPRQAVPGRPRRRKATNSRMRQQEYGSSISLYSILHQMRITFCQMGTSEHRNTPLWILVLLWYSLGVVSISTSKILLSGGYGDGSFLVSPLTLTLQQLFIGTSVLRGLLHLQAFGSSGLQHLSFPGTSATDHRNPGVKFSSTVGGRRDLVMTAISFALGFLATNFGFAGSAPSFVETIKAAEPITSATVAVLYGIETITLPQSASLGSIVVGVLISTMGHGGSSSSRQSFRETMIAATIVMASNLFFSFRGLYQKLLRLHTSAEYLDDLNLQFRMQWIGVMTLAVPALVFDFLPMLWYRTMSSTDNNNTLAAPITERNLKSTNDHPVWLPFLRYCVLSLFNGIAFASYNLASTYILSRISFVHHAALNCIRRVFAIIMTSIFFGIPITLAGSIGICIAVAGFMSFTHFKVQQQRYVKQSGSSLLPVSNVGK